MLDHLMNAISEDKEAAGLEMDGAVGHPEMDTAREDSQLDLEVRAQLEAFVLGHTPCRHKFTDAKGRQCVVYFDERGRAADCPIDLMAGEELIRLAKYHGWKGDRGRGSSTTDPGYRVPVEEDDEATLEPGQGLVTAIPILGARPREDDLSEDQKHSLGVIRDAFGDKPFDEARAWRVGLTKSALQDLVDARVIQVEEGSYRLAPMREHVEGWDALGESYVDDDPYQTGPSKKMVARYGRFAWGHPEDPIKHAEYIRDQANTSLMASHLSRAMGAKYRFKKWEPMVTGMVAAVFEGPKEKGDMEPPRIYVKANAKDKRARKTTGGLTIWLTTRLPRQEGGDDGGSPFWDSSTFVGSLETFQVDFAKKASQHLRRFAEDLQAVRNPQPYKTPKPKPNPKGMRFEPRLRRVSEAKRRRDMDDVELAKAGRMSRKKAVDFALSDYQMLRDDGRTAQEAWEGALNNFEDTFEKTPALQHWQAVMKAVDRAAKKDGFEA